jgi:hypothetical protein
MKRTPLARNTPLKAKSVDPKTGERRFSTFAQPIGAAARTSSLKRTRMQLRRRRAKPGDDPAYKAWIKTFPCVVGGLRCEESDPHHIIDGRGAQRKGMGQTAKDRDTFPMCRQHHDEFHDRVGFCKGWTDDERRTFQEQEIERFQALHRDKEELGVLQEPVRRAI